MTRVDYRQLFEHIPALVASYDPADHKRPWHLHDRSTGQLFARISTFPQADSFLRALERKGDATVDWFQVEQLRALAASLDLLTRSGEPTAREANRTDGAVSEPLVSQAAAGTAEPASPDNYLRRVPDNVVPLRGA